MFSGRASPPGGRGGRTKFRSRMNPSRRLTLILVLGSLMAVLAAGALAAPDRAAAGARKARAHPSSLPPAAAAIAVNPKTGDQYAFWRTPGGRIEEAYDNGSWHGPISRGWRPAPPRARRSTLRGISSSPSRAPTATSSRRPSFAAGAARSISPGPWAGAPAGTTSTVPALAVAPASDHRYLFWRGSDGRIHEAWNNGRWHRPINRGWKTTSAPTAAASRLRPAVRVLDRARRRHPRVAHTSGVEPPDRSDAAYGLGAPRPS